MYKHWTSDLIETITFSNNDQRAIAASYRDYLASISGVQSRIVGAMLELQSEISVREERPIGVASPAKMVAGITEGYTEVSFQTMGIQSFGVDSELTPELQSAVWLFNEGYVTIHEFDVIVDGLSNDYTLRSLLPDRMITEYGDNIDGFLNIVAINSIDITSLPHVDFIDDIDVSEILERHGLTDNTTFVTQNGDVINLKAAMLAIREASAIDSDLPIALSKMVSAANHPITSSDLYNDIAASLQSTKALEIGFDILASSSDLTANASELMTRMNLTFNDISSDVYPILDFVSSQLVNSQTSVLDKIGSLSSFFARAEEAIELSTEGGILLDVSDDYTGASPAAAWVSGVEIDPASIASFVVSSIKAAAQLYFRARAWLTLKTMELGLKAISWTNDNIVNARDIEVVDEKSVNHAVDFPFLQFDAYLYDYFITDWADSVSSSTIEEFYKPDGRVIEMTYSFATIRIFPYYGGNGDPSIENHKLQIAIFLAPTRADFLQSLGGENEGEGLFPRWYEHYSSVTPKQAFDNCFKQTGISIREDASDKEYFKGFQASIARLSMFISLLDLNIRNVSEANAKWNIVAPYADYWVSFDQGFNPQFLSPSTSLESVNSDFEAAINAWSFNDPSNADFAKLMRGKDAVSHDPGRFWALIAAIAATSDAGQTQYYDDRGGWAPFISYKRANSIIPPKYILKSDAENAQFFSKVLLVIGAVAAVVVIGVAALKIRKALRLKMIHQEAVIGAQMRTLGSLSSSDLSTLSITNDIRRKQRKLRRTQQLLRLFGIAPVAAASGALNWSMSDGTTELSNKVNEIASHLYSAK